MGEFEGGVRERNAGERSKDVPSPPVHNTTVVRMPSPSGPATGQ